MIFITIFISTILSLLLRVCAAPIQARDISFADLSEYLWAHNVIRAEYSAAPLIWSDDLAAGAQQWADACNFRHTDGVLSETPYGENIAAATGTFDVTSAVKSFMEGQGEFEFKIK